MHEGAAGVEYGVASSHFALIVAGIVNSLQIGHILDYGCGAHTNLARAFSTGGDGGKPMIGHALRYQAYDPAVPRFSRPPLPAEMVVCLDVLEHVEPECLDAVLDDLASLTQEIIFGTICTIAAKKSLPDGRNAHLIQQPMRWWFPKLDERWIIQTLQAMEESHFYFVGYSKHSIQDVDGKVLT